MGPVRGCLSRIGCLTLLVLGVTAGWLYRPEIEAGWNRAVAGAGTLLQKGDTAAVAPAPGAVAGGDEAVGPGASPEASGGEGGPEPARTDADGSSEARTDGDGGPAAGDAPAPVDGAAVDAFLTAPVPATLRLDDAALAVILEERVEPGLPEGVARPAATVEDSALAVAADVDLRRTLGERLPSMLARMVGDSARVRAIVHPSVPEHGVLRLRVRELRAGSVGLPTMTLPWLLTELGLPLAPDDPTAVDLAVGRDLAEARVRDGALVLVRRSPAAVPAPR